MHLWPCSPLHVRIWKLCMHRKPFVPLCLTLVTTCAESCQRNRVSLNVVCSLKPIKQENLQLVACFCGCYTQEPHKMAFSGDITVFPSFSGAPKYHPKLFNGCTVLQVATGLGCFKLIHGFYTSLSLHGWVKHPASRHVPLSEAPEQWVNVKNHSYLQTLVIHSK